MSTEPPLTRAPRRTSPGWVFLPALGAPLAPAPVLRWNLLPRLRRPISRRLFGENKTWRGALVMTGSTVTANPGPGSPTHLPATAPRAARASQSCPAGEPARSRVLAGELPNSFLKRRLGIPPGEQRASPVGAAISIFDQADWVPIAWLLLRPMWKTSAREAAQIRVLVAAIHVPINLIGYAVGVRTAPL